MPAKYSLTPVINDPGLSVSMFRAMLMKLKRRLMGFNEILRKFRSECGLALGERPHFSSLAELLHGKERERGRGGGRGKQQ